MQIDALVNITRETLLRQKFLVESASETIDGHLQH